MEERDADGDADNRRRRADPVSRRMQSGLEWETRHGTSAGATGRWRDKACSFPGAKNRLLVVLEAAGR